MRLLKIYLFTLLVVVMSVAGIFILKLHPTELHNTVRDAAGFSLIWFAGIMSGWRAYQYSNAGSTPPSETSARRPSADKKERGRYLPYFNAAGGVILIALSIYGLHTLDLPPGGLIMSVPAFALVFCIALGGAMISGLIRDPRIEELEQKNWELQRELDKKTAEHRSAEKSAKPQPEEPVQPAPINEAEAQDP